MKRFLCTVAVLIGLGVAIWYGLVALLVFRAH